MFQTFEEVESYLKEHGIQMVDLKFCDLWGRWRHITLPSPRFTLELIEEGVGFDGSSLGFKSIRASDLVLAPDISTGVPDPFYDVPTLSFICAILEADNHAPLAEDPRNIAIRAEAYLRDCGVADESRWGPEYEFYLFDEVLYEGGINRAMYRLQSEEADWECAEVGSGNSIPLHQGYHALPPSDKLFNLRTEITLNLEKMEVPVKYHHHEVGSFGQCEIEVPMLGMVSAGDATLLTKYITKMTANTHGKTATFMPKPLYNEAGNGMHFHQQLLLKKKNIFYSEAGYGFLSQTALHYLGGILSHSPALMALTNPSTNSYRRLVPGYEAPVYPIFSLGNRSAAIRIPRYANKPDTVRLEFRTPDAACNIYLALAAQLLAGIDGIIKEIDPTAAGFGPIEEDIFSWDDAKKQSLQRLPGSLEEALVALEMDHEFLMVGEIFSEELIQRWIDHKKTTDCYAIRSRPHPYEMKLYFDI
jgi:glutamine synthetase